MHPSDESNYMTQYTNTVPPNMDGEPWTYDAVILTSQQAAQKRALAEGGDAVWRYQYVWVDPDTSIISYTYGDWEGPPFP